MEQHITKYNEFYSKNGQFVGGTDSMVVSLFTGIENISGNIFNMFLKSTEKFLALIDRTFKGIVDSGKKLEDDLFRILINALKGAQYEKIPESQIPRYYGAFQLAMRDAAPAFYGGAECNCGENVMDYWTNSAYLVFKGGVETEKNVAFMIAGINTLIDLINKSMKSKSSEFNEPQVRELVKLYSDALEQLKKAVNDVNSELMKKNANLRKDFDTYAKYTPEEIIKQLEYKAKNNAARAEFLQSIKLLAPTAYYANTLNSALSKLGLAVKDFEAADTEGKFSSLMNKLMLNISASDPNYVKKMEALELLKKIHQSQPVKFEAAAEYEEVNNEEEYERPDYGQFFGGGGGESIFGGELLELDKKVDMISKADNLYQSPLEMSFKQENEKMLVELVQNARDASDEMYEKKSISDDQDLIEFLTRLDGLRIIDISKQEFENMFFKESNLFGIGYSRDTYLLNLDNVIVAGKKVESKIGPKFSNFIKYLESYKKFLLESSNKATEIVSRKGFSAKFFGGLQTTWSYTMGDVIDTFVRGIVVSRMRTGLDHSVKELESYQKDQSNMNAKIMGREINNIIRKCEEIVNGAIDHSTCPIPKELFKVVLQENLDGFINLQRASQALNERCRIYQMSLIKNPTKAREIADLLKKVAIDINSIGDESFTHLTEFLEYFHIESIAKDGNKYKDAAEFSQCYDLMYNNAKFTPHAPVAGETNRYHELSLYDNGYLGKKYDEVTPFPIKLTDVLASHVPTMICATTDGNHVKKSKIGADMINAYGGKRIFPAKVTNIFNGDAESMVIPANKTEQYGTRAGVAQPGIDLTARNVADAATDDYSITRTIMAPSYLPRVVKFIDKNKIISLYNEATEHLNKGIRQITSLKNLFSVFQSIDKAYQNEKGVEDKSSMKIGEIYEAFVNYIVKTTRYPIIYKIKEGQYACSHIALRKFGYDVVMPFENKDTFRTTRNNMFNILDSLSLREYFDGPDYGNLQADRTVADPFPKTTESTYVKPKNIESFDKDFYFNNNRNFSMLFNECDNLCVMSLKSITAKIFSVLSLFNVINLNDLTTNLNFSQLRGIYGGLDLSHTITPQVKADNSELYLRLYLLMLFYKGLFFEEAHGVGQEHIIAGAKRMAVLPGGNSKFDELLKFMFLRQFDKLLAVQSQKINTLDIVNFGIFIDICNKLAEAYKGSTIQHIQTIVVDLVDEINRRYGIVSTDQIKELMKKEKNRVYPNMRKLDNLETLSATTRTVERVPPTLLDGEGSDFRKTSVDSDQIQFGETTVGRVLTLINPETDKFNMTEILAVVYNFRKKLDKMLSTMDTVFVARTASGVQKPLYNNIKNKCIILQRQLANFNDNRGKLEFIKKYFETIGNVTLYNINNEEVLYKELVLTPCSIINKLYNRLIAMSNLYGKQKYNNILNLNTHLYDLDSINTDLVTVVRTSDMPKLDFSKLASTCDSFIQQIILFHKQFITGLGDTNNILQKTINLLINQHNYVWSPDGPLSDNTLDYKSIVFVPINDYSEFPNVIYNAGTENAIGRNSWTAYRGKNVYDENVIIEDPRLRSMKVNKPENGLGFPMLNMKLLTERFSPKNPYQLLEYMLILMYKVFYQQVGIVYQPLFEEFVNRLSDVIDFNNIQMNDNTAELGGVHGYQKGMPFSDKIGIVYRTLYRYKGKSTLIQPDLTLIPSDGIRLMKKYIPFFLFLTKCIIKQSYIHSQIIALKRYSGGVGLDGDDRDNYTQGIRAGGGVVNAKELFPPSPAVGAIALVAEYKTYFETLLGNGVGIGMELYAGALTKYINNQSILNNFQEALNIALKTTIADKKTTTDFNATLGGLNKGDLSYNGQPLNTKISTLFLNKYTNNGGQLFNILDTVQEYDFTALEDAKKSNNKNELKSEIVKYYTSGISKQLFQPKNITITPVGNAINNVIHDVFDSKLFDGAAMFFKKYIEDIIKETNYFDAGHTPDQNLTDFINGVSPVQHYSRYVNPITEFGLAVSAGPTPVGIPARNMGSNSYIKCANVGEINVTRATLNAAIAPLDPVARHANNVAAAVAFNSQLAPNIDMLYGDAECNTPITPEQGIHGKLVYVKVPTDVASDRFRSAFIGDDNVTYSDRMRDDASWAIRDDTANHKTIFGQHGPDPVNDDMVGTVIWFIDNVNTSHANIYGTQVHSPNEFCGLIPDALLMYNKYLKLGLPYVSFEDYLPHFIEERIELILGKNSEAFSSIVFDINPTMTLEIVAGAGGGVAGATTRPFGLLGGDDIAPRAALAQADYRGALDTEHRLIQDGGIKMIDHVMLPGPQSKFINEFPGCASLGAYSTVVDTNLYNKFKYTDSNIYYDMILCASARNIHCIDAAANLLNSVTRSTISSANTYNSNNGAAVLAATSAAMFNIAAGNDPSHKMSMSNLDRIRSSCVNIPKASHAIDGRFHLLSIMYEIILRVITTCSTEKTFEARYDHFKTKILNGFLKAYTPYLDKMSLDKGMKNNKLYKYLPIIANPRWVINANVYETVRDTNTSTINRIMHGTTIQELGLMLDVGTYGGAATGLPGFTINKSLGVNNVNEAINTAINNPTILGKYIAGDASVDTMLSAIESNFIKDGNFIYPSLINPDSDTVTKLKWLAPIFNMRDTALNSTLLTTIILVITNHIKFNVAPFNMYTYIARILSLPTEQFLIGIYGLYKLMFFAIGLIGMYYVVGKYPKDNAGLDIKIDLYDKAIRNSCSTIGFVSVELFNSIKNYDTIMSETITVHPMLTTTGMNTLRKTVNSITSFPQKPINHLEKIDYKDLGDNNFILKIAQYANTNIFGPGKLGSELANKNFSRAVAAGDLTKIVNSVTDKVFNDVNLQYFVKLYIPTTNGGNGKCVRVNAPDAILGATFGIGTNTAFTDNQATGNVNAISNRVFRVEDRGSYEGGNIEASWGAGTGNYSMIISKLVFMASINRPISDIVIEPTGQVNGGVTIANLTNAFKDSFLLLSNLLTSLNESINVGGATQLVSFNRLVNTYKSVDTKAQQEAKRSLIKNISDLSSNGEYVGPNAYPLCSHIDSLFVDGLIKNNCINSCLELFSYWKTISSPKSINRLIFAKALNTVYSKNTLSNILNFDNIYAPFSQIAGAHGYQFKYELSTATQPETASLRIDTPANLLARIDAFYTESAKLYKILYNSIGNYSEVINKLYFTYDTKGSAVGFKSTREIIEPTGDISILSNRNLAVLRPDDAAVQGVLGPTAPNDIFKRNKQIIDIVEYKVTAFVDENGVDQHCIMSDLALPGVDENDMSSRSKNAILFGLIIHKSLSGVYNELNDNPKYLETDPTLSDLNSLVDRAEKRMPFTYANELLPNIVNSYMNIAGIKTECNVLKTVNMGTIKSINNLGIHCKNIYDLDKLIIGDKSDVFNLIRLFLFSDSMYPLTAKDFPWLNYIINNASGAQLLNNKLEQNNLTSYIQTMAKLTKYLYEIDFKSMFGNMFPVFNNLDNPKFDINTQPGPSNPMHGMFVKSYGNNIAIRTLETSLCGLFSYRGQLDAVRAICPFDDMIELTFGQRNLVAAIDLRSIGFTERKMIDPIKLYQLLEIDSNSPTLNKILTINGIRMGAKVGTYNDFDQLLGENILDLGIFPLNIHSMAKEIPMAEMINNVYNYDIIMKWLLSHNTNVANAGFYISNVHAKPRARGHLSYEKYSRLTEPVGGYVNPDGEDPAVAGSASAKLRDLLCKNQLYNYVVNPLGSYIFPVKFAINDITATSWQYFNPTASGTSKLNSINKSKLDNLVGIHPSYAAGGAAADEHLATRPTNADVYVPNMNIGNIQKDIPVCLTEDYMDVAAGSLGKHLINGIINNSGGPFNPIQHNMLFISEADAACFYRNINPVFTQQTVNLSLGCQLIESNIKISNRQDSCVIKNSKLINKLMGVCPRTNITNAPPNFTVKGGGGVAVIAPGQNVLVNGAITYDDQSYYYKQRVGTLPFLQMDLMHGVDLECQQPVLGLNIFADVLMNIYTAKLYDEIKTQRQRSSQVSIGEAAIFDQYYH